MNVKEGWKQKWTPGGAKDLQREGGWGNSGEKKNGAPFDAPFSGISL
jgi:hypothetical protein